MTFLTLRRFKFNKLIEQQFGSLLPYLPEQVFLYPLYFSIFDKNKFNGDPALMYEPTNSQHHREIQASKQLAS